MLLEGNYNDFNIRNLAKNCSLGLGTLYNYFTSKEDLVFQIFQSDWDKTLKLVDDLKSKNLSFENKLKLIFSSLELFVGQYMRVFREIAGSGQNGCPHDSYKDISVKMTEFIDEEKRTGRVNSEVESVKLSIFILNNFFHCAQNKYMTIDELLGCMKF
jgi:AcrR family transcriptional regulator